VLKQGQGTFVADDVKAASRHHALAEARQVLAHAVARAQQLGLTGAALREFVRELLAREKGGSDARD
jgi:DNA-binding transcriptional regulator YhcF (GntR family)